MSTNTQPNLRAKHVVADSATLHNLQSNYVRFCTGDYDGLTLVSKNDTQCDSGFTATNGGFHEIAWDGGGASAIALPSAVSGSIVVFHFTAPADGAANVVVSCASGDTFHAQTLSHLTQNSGDAHLLQRVYGKRLTGTHGTVNSTFTALHNTLTISATATDNQTNIGAEVSFFCNTDKKWRIAFRGSELGSGALNATFAGSTV
jgi:hypothetical protein